MTAALLLCALAANEPASTPSPPPTPSPSIEAPVEVEGWHFAGVPLASYGSDVGLTLGAGVFLYRAVPGHEDEHDQLTLSFSYATRGPRSFDTTWADQRLFGWPLRFTWNVHLADDDRMPYWGEGAQLGGLGVPAGYGTPPEPYRYHDRRVFTSATLQGWIVGSLGWHVRLRWVDVDVVSAGPLLAASQPPGARGGRVGLGELGLLWDTRDRPTGPRRGAFLTASAFVAPQLDGVTDFAFHGYHAEARAYLPLPLSLTLALRGMYDRKEAGVPFGHPDAGAAVVPFFERVLYEGIAYGEGLGGADTVRGIARYRLSGEEKALVNVQLRIELFTLHLFEKTQDFGLDVGGDAGHARQYGYPAVQDATLTAGIRFLWDRTILLRVEVGRARGGDNTVYISFGEQF